MMVVPRERERERSQRLFFPLLSHSSSMVVVIVIRRHRIYVCREEFVERKGEVFSSSSSFANYIQMSLLLL
jgi:hypothetical protein